MSDDTISNLEKGNISIEFERLLDLCDYLGISFYSIFEGTFLYDKSEAVKIEDEINALDENKRNIVKSLINILYLRQRSATFMNYADESVISDDVLVQIGINLRYARLNTLIEQKNNAYGSLSQKELAQKSGIKVNKINEIENGKCKRIISYIMGISRSLDVNFYSIFKNTPMYKAGTNDLTEKLISLTNEDLCLIKEFIGRLKKIQIDSENTNNKKSKTKK